MMLVALFLFGELSGNDNSPVVHANVDGLLQLLIQLFKLTANQTRFRERRLYGDIRFCSANAFVNGAYTMTNGCRYPRID